MCIRDRGIGNGISFIILIGIIARFPDALIQEVVSRVANKLSLIHIFTASVPEKSLVYGKKSSGGRNSEGKMTMRYIGGQILNYSEVLVYGNQYK